MNSTENSKINPEVIVIGAGMIGSMVTKVLRHNGVKVLLLDCKKPLSGSKCSSGMWRDGWVGDKIREQYEEGIEVLHEHAGIDFIDVENLDPVKVKGKVVKQEGKRMDELMYVDWRKICDVESENIEVVDVHNNIVKCIQNRNKGHFNEQLKTQFVAKYAVFICAGAYTDEILETSHYSPIGIDRQFGTCIEASGIKKPFSAIRTWAPYKQFLAAQVGANIMKFSDGSMVKNPKENDERCVNVHERLKERVVELMGKHFNFKNGIRELFGLRPYMPKDYKGGFVNKHDRDLYSCTGTAKNTTILCGHVALKAWEIVNEKIIAKRGSKTTKVKH